MPEPGFTAVCFLMPIHNRSLKTQLLPAQSFICSHVWIRGCRIFLRCTWAQPFRTSTYIWIWRCYLWTLDGGSRSSFFFLLQVQGEPRALQLFFLTTDLNAEQHAFFFFYPPFLSRYSWLPTVRKLLRLPPTLNAKGGKRNSCDFRAALCLAYLWVLIKIIAWINSRVHFNEDEDRTGEVNRPDSSYQTNNDSHKTTSMTLTLWASLPSVFPLSLSLYLSFYCFSSTPPRKEFPSGCLNFIYLHLDEKSL